MRKYDNTPGQNRPTFLENLSDLLPLLLAVVGGVLVVFFGLMAFLSN